MSGIPGNKVGS